MSVNSPRGHAGSRPIRHSRRLGLGLISLLLVLVGGTLGYVAFGYGVLDAVFQTVITVTTVGFGEVHRFGTGQKVFTIALILTGVGAAAYSFTVAVETLLEGDLADEFGRRRMERQIRQARDHVVLCGWGRVGRAIAGSLRSSKVEVVVIDSSAERAGTVDGPSLCGDATDEDVLRAAGIDRAAALITALNGDADKLYVALTARFLAPRPVHRVPDRFEIGHWQTPPGWSQPGGEPPGSRWCTHGSARHSAPRSRVPGRGDARRQPGN